MKIVITKNVLSFFESNGSFQFQRVLAETFKDSPTLSCTGTFSIYGQVFVWNIKNNGDKSVVYIDIP